MSDVVSHWGRIIHSFKVGRISNTVLVFDTYYLDDAGRQGLRAKSGAVNPKRFPLLNALVPRGVDMRRRWKALWSEKRKY